MEDRYIVVCLDDDKQYRLTTRQTFTKEEAETRASGIAPSRNAIVVACDNRTVILRKEEL